MSNKKKGFSLSHFVKKCDLFGSHLDFTFQGNHYFGTGGGFFCSIIIVIFVLYISFGLISSILQYDNYDSYSEIQEKSDFNAIEFDEIFTNSALIENKNHVNFLKFAFAVVDKKTNKLVPYDPSYLIIKGYSKNDTINKESFLSNCNKNFFYLKKEKNENFQIDKSYCFYSKNHFKKVFNEDKDFQGFYMKLNICKNNTHSIVEENNFPSHDRLIEKIKLKSIEDSKNKDNKTFLMVDLIEDNKNIDDRENNNQETKIFGENDNFYKYYPSNFTNINLNILHNDIIKFNKINKTETKPLICKTEDQIFDYLYNVKIRFYYDSFSHNLTNYDNPTFRQFKYYEGVLDYYSEKRVVIYFMNSYIKSQVGIIPLSLNKKVNIYNYQELSSIKTSYVNYRKDNSTNIINYIDKGNEDIYDDNTLLRIIISLSNNEKYIERTYNDLFMIMGYIGGFSKFLMVFFMILLSYYINIRKKEALIKELYSSSDGLSIKKVGKIINKNLFKVDYYTYQKCYLYLKEIYKKNGYDILEKEFKKFLKCSLNNSKLNENKNNFNGNIESNNKPNYIVDSEAFNNVDSENINSENSKSMQSELDYTYEEIYEIQLNLQNLYTNSYIEVSKENGKFHKFWKVDDSDPEKKSKEFYNRIALKALIKLFFSNKSKYFDILKQAKNENDNNNINENNNNVIKTEKIKEIENTEKEGFGHDNFKFKEAEIFLDENYLGPQKNQKFINFLSSDYINKLEYINYANLIENFTNKSVNVHFHFNIIWMHFMYCFKKCSTKKYQKHLDDFDEAYDEIVEQSEFKNIYSSLQEFEKFKKSYFEKGQLYMFQSCPKKVITSNCCDKEILGNGNFFNNFYINFL
jgi:hypothetical protein